MIAPAKGVARRWLLFALVATTTAAGVWVMARTVAAQGVTVLEVVILLLFAPTFAWIVVPFWTAVAGFILRMLRLDPLTLRRVRTGPGALPGSGTAAPTESLTALVVPVFKEDPDAVAARIAAMVRSLVATGFADRFHFHILSDTPDPDIWAREEVAWVRLQAEHPEIPIFYRRRESNTGRKAGNVGEFCRRCVDDYDFMVVLDADSLMSGSTLVALAARMEADPELGLVQTVPLPVLQDTLFGRLIQFAGCLYGPLLATGLSFWQTDSGNYWGHNAIVRLRPFTEHCELPVLPGRPPLGGEVLSHDFVEGALLRRAGWKVELAAGLDGSWEEVPGNVPDYATRDRRWAQGSLQHLRLLRLPGLHPASRVHFTLGAMGFVSSLLWLLFLLAGTVYVLAPDLHGPRIADPFTSPGGSRAFLLDVSLLAVTAVILFLPKFLGVVDGMVSRRRSFGGSLRLSASALTEGLFSVLMAPIMMLYHAVFVVSIVLGRSVPWEPQRRGGSRLSWADALRAAAAPTVVGVVWGGATLMMSPLFFAWLSPILAGLLLSAPLLRWTSSPSLGQTARRVGLLRVPSEVVPPREVSDVRSALRGGVEDRLLGEDHRYEEDPIEKTGVLREPGNVGAKHSLIAGSSMYNAERGLFDLRQGRPLLVTEETGDARSGRSATLLAAVEGLDSNRAERLLSLCVAPPRLVLTRHRLAAMGLTSSSNGAHPSSNGVPSPNGTSGTYALRVETDASLHRLVELSCSAIPTGGIEGLQLSPATGAEEAGLALVRLGRLLPAVVAVPVAAPYPEEIARMLDDGALLRVDADEVRAFVASAGAEVVPISEAPVPLAEGADSRFILFREGHGLQEHVAILVGNEAEWPDPVPVRLHSACLTGDLFGSLRCDCGEQLRGSMRLFDARGGGILLYLAQEGRGIGLRNKFRAYTLQEGGLDTIDADSALGFGPDERRYDVAVRILQMIGVKRIELLTNNPEKVRAMEEAGITVVRRRPLHGTLNRHNLPYVRAKVQRAGHWLGDMLSQELSGD
ncbi:MAG: glucans biosynthesis glucosyltransferase MdoH [Gemmatimonadetes bacterium]|nr:glucans biosynthesis glucosyltransferase MdoH [Gemmatimonadota bacterium]